MSDRTNAIEMFVDEPVAPPVILDRSTLERWAECPHSAYLIGKRQVSVGGPLLDVGSAVHDIIGHAVKIRNETNAPLRLLRESCEELAIKSRPDIQPQVVSACRGIYPILDYICNKPYDAERSPDDLLRYDGGEGPKSGQLAADILPEAEDGSRGPIRLTGELDLMVATLSPEEVGVCDWKAGWRHWTATDVAEAFQFQFYAWLVFRNYPTVNVVRFRVFMPRYGTSTSAVEFRRDQMHQIHGRLLSAVDIYLEHASAADAEDVPAWPQPERCSQCDAVAYCKVAHKPDADFALDPEGYLKQYVVVAELEMRMKALMSAAVKREKSDLVFGKIAFGQNAPKTNRAAVCKLYTIGGSAEEGE